MSHPCAADDRHVRIQAEIVRLLTYPQVGPFGAAVIARNLGLSEREVSPALAALVTAGRLTRSNDRRFALARAPGAGTASVPQRG